MLSKKVKIEGSRKQVEDANQMWVAMEEGIRRSGKEMLGSSRGGGGKMEGAW